MKRKEKKKKPLVRLVLPANPVVQEGRQSEVALLMKQFRDEEEAAQRGLYGFAQTAQHEIITARMERWGILQEELTQLVGENAAARIVVEAMGADVPSAEVAHEESKEP